MTSQDVQLRLMLEGTNVCYSTAAVKVPDGRPEDIPNMAAGQFLDWMDCTVLMMAQSQAQSPSPRHQHQHHQHHQHQQHLGPISGANSSVSQLPRPAVDDRPPPFTAAELARLGLPPGLASATGKLEDWEKVEVDIAADKARAAATIARSHRVTDVARTRMTLQKAASSWKRPRGASVS